MDWKKLIIIGDSNTQFGFSKEGKWLSLLADKLQRKCDIINRGFSGYNSRFIKTIISKIMSEFSIANIYGVIIFIGTNDCSTNDQQHVPIDEYGSNLENIFNYLFDIGIQKERIISITPPRINDGEWTANRLLQNLISSHFDKNAKQYSDKCNQISNKYSIKCLNLYDLMTTTANYKEYLVDGLHLSELGSQLLFDNIWPLIETNIKDELKYNFLYWKDIKNDEYLNDIPQFN